MPLEQKPAATFEQHEFHKEFEIGFSTRSHGAVRQCVCGRVFYNPGGDWDWEDGELDALGKHTNATSLEWAAGEVWFEGTAYAADCTCWHDRALKIANWLLAHDREIAAFLSAVKAAKMARANAAPTVTP